MLRIFNINIGDRVILWARLVALGVWFELPEKILVARTFCRDAWDVIYLDHMDYLERLASSLDIPLQNDDLPLFYLRISL